MTYLYRQKAKAFCRYTFRCMKTVHVVDFLNIICAHFQQEEPLKEKEQLKYDIKT